METPSFDSRKDLYSLRQGLVARLQTAARGLPRGDRARLHHSFARQWRWLSDRQMLTTLARAVREGRAESLRSMASGAPSLDVVLPLAEELCGSVENRVAA